MGPRSRRKPVTQTQEFISESGKQSLLDERQELEDTLRQAEDYGKGSPAEQIDKENIRRQIRHIDNTIDHYSLGKVKGKTLDSFVREAKELEARFEEGLPTKYEMDHPAKCPGAIRKHQSWLARNEKYIERWRYIQNIINPGAPKSIEELRKSGTPRY